MGQHHRGGVGPRATWRMGALLLCFVCLQCSGANSPTTPSGPQPVNSGPPNPNPTPFPPGPLAAPEIFAGAGDIAWCNNGNASAVARLLDTVGGTIFTLGDNVYMSGTTREFR